MDLSITEAEYMAAASAEHELVWLKTLQEQHGLPIPETTTLHEKVLAFYSWSTLKDSISDRITLVQRTDMCKGMTSQGKNI